jgi:type I restriction enzyme R subunit
MRQALVNLNSDLVAKHPDYVARVTSDEGDIGKGKLGRFQDPDADVPVILTTSQLLTTGVDAPTCKNVVLARVVGSMAEFKQIIGRGTRLREDYGKLWFSIIDYTGTATAKFADPAFDGEPVAEIVTEIDAEGDVIATEIEEHELPVDGEEAGDGPVELPPDGPDVLPRKFYVDGGDVEVVAHLVYDLDSEGRRLTCHKLTDWTGEKVRTLFATPAAFRAHWALPDKRSAIIDELAERGIDLAALQADAGHPEDDAFDLLCHLAWNAPTLTRAERAKRVRSAAPDLFEKYGDEARTVLNALLDRYAADGPDQLTLPEALKVQPVSDFGNPSEIARLFGGPKQMRHAVEELTSALYAA